MLDSDPYSPARAAPAQAGPIRPRLSARGAVALAAIAALVVMGIWFAFYMLVFLPRGAP